MTRVCPFCNNPVARGFKRHKQECAKKYLSGLGLPVGTKPPNRLGDTPPTRGRMALHLTPAEHDADPPSGWTVRKLTARRWQLLNRRGGVLDTFDTKKQAEEAKKSGFLVNLYEKEGRWFKGETPPGHRPYSECKAKMDEVAAREGLL
jgi:hypothetical protein